MYINFAKSIENRYLSQNITLMDRVIANRNPERWVEEQLSLGRYGFSLRSLRESLDQYTDTAIKFALKRLTDKGKVISIYKGYYLIIPPQYHGASHQQPQEFFVMTTFPVLRPTKRKGLKLNYISINNIPEKLLEQKKTESGYLTVSSPVLTATDLVQFEKRIGGLNRAATVLNELIEVIGPADFSQVLLEYAPVTALQRLGYLLEFAFLNTELADALFTAMKIQSLNFYRIPLKSSIPVRGHSSGNRWSVIVNAKIEIDE
jgi:predicted transcriptional regulator of viral defense system